MYHDDMLEYCVYAKRANREFTIVKKKKQDIQMNQLK